MSLCTHSHRHEFGCLGDCLSVSRVSDFCRGISLQVARPKSSEKEYIKERWYGVEYARRPLSLVEVETLRSAVSRASEMGMPPANAFVPAGLSLASLPTSAAAAEVPPQLIESGSLECFSGPHKGHC